MGTRSARDKKSKGEQILEKRMAQLEKELLGGKVLNKKSRDKKPEFSSDDSSSDSDSDRSASPRHRRRHRSSFSESGGDRRRTSRRRSESADRSKKGKYDRKRQMERGDTIDNADMLLVYLIRLLRKYYKRGKRVGGLIDHVLVMAEKNETGYYKLASLVGYDDECREVASEKGLKTFGDVKPSTVLKFLCYDSTKSAKNQGVQQGQNQTNPGQRRKSEGKGSCFKFNGSGCHSHSCQFEHACMFCGDTAHGSQGCRERKIGSSG